MRVAPLVALLFTAAAAQATERTVTFLHIADTHAQLETHAEYMPGEIPELRDGRARASDLPPRVWSQDAALHHNENP